MACDKRKETGHCGHYQCPYPGYTAHGYECVDIFGKQCEIGDGCLSFCEFSYTMTAWDYIREATVLDDDYNAIRIIERRDGKIWDILETWSYDTFVCFLHYIKVRWGRPLLNDGAAAADITVELFKKQSPAPAGYCNICRFRADTDSHQLCDRCRWDLVVQLLKAFKFFF